MTDRNTIAQVIESLFEDWIDKNINVHPLAVENMRILEADALALLKEQDELLKHEYWRGYNNGRADERGLQEGTIMQTFSPD